MKVSCKKSMGSFPGKFHEKADEQLKPNFVTEVFKENYTTNTTNILIKYCNKKEVKPYDSVFIVHCSSKQGTALQLLGCVIQCIVRRNKETSCCVCSHSPSFIQSDEMRVLTPGAALC